MIVETPVELARVVWPTPRRRGSSLTGERTASLLLAGDEAGDRPDGVESSVVLDFGVELFGGVRFRVQDAGAGPALLRVRLGESVSEAIAGTYVDRRVAASSGTEVDVGRTGFRFARIDLESPAGRVELSPPVAYGLADDAPRLGAFACSDPRLDQVWDVGARTAHLCMQGVIWDGIKRGQRVWAGDLHPASHAVAAAFGAHPAVVASLDHLRDKTSNGQGLPDGWMNGIPAYSLWWLITQAEWYELTGDLTYLEPQRRYLAGLVERILPHLGDDGCERYAGWRYLDWATTNDPVAVQVGYQGLTAWALWATAGLLETLGEPDAVARCSDGLRRLVSCEWPDTPNKQAHALLVLGGLADPTVTNHSVLSVDPAGGLTPFLGYHVLEARARGGDVSGGLDLIREYWGAMIDLGATTFWEDFDRDWVPGSCRIDRIVPPDLTLRDVHAGLGRNGDRGMDLSLCHAWSAGPTAWLSRHVLGVRPAEPGCARVVVRPELGDLAWASGRVPTPHGVVEVRHERRPDGSVGTTVRAPEGVEVVPAG